MKHLIETDRLRGQIIEVAFTPAADGQGLVVDNATDAKISRIHARFSDAAAAVSGMLAVAKFRRGVRAIIVDTPDASPGSEPH